MNQGIKLTGKGDNIPATHILCAGEISMLYEAGNLRYITAGGYEIIRMIYFAVRDKDWLTISPVIHGEKISKKKYGFEIKYKAQYKYNEIDFEADISINSASPNRLRLEMKGTANSTFMKNRIGFCVLHPISNCAGHECIITHPDGGSALCRFPEEISPHQPFRNIRAMQWKIKDSLAGKLYFEGDVFETEDQRNWTDASYKTYSTPLDQPFPVEVTKGTSLYQFVEFSLEGKHQDINRNDDKISFIVGEPGTKKLPDIGVGVSSRRQALDNHEADILKNLHFSHIRGELHLFSKRLEKQYAVLSGESLKCDIPAEICLFFGKHPLAELAKFLALFYQNPIHIKHITVFSETAKVPANTLLSIIMPVLRREFPGIPAGTGTNCNFTQLNRARPEFNDIDFVTFAIHPQEHASDERTLIENTAAQQFAVQSAAKFEIHKPVVVSPVTIQRRFNANRKNFEMPAHRKEIPAGVDPRQMSLFGACWTVGSLKYLLASEVSSITYYETVGERGLLMGNQGSRWPGLFNAGKGMIFPVFHIFKALREKGKFRVHGSYSTNPLVIDGFAVADENSGKLFLSNMTREVAKVMLSGIEKYKTTIKLNAGNFNEITGNFQLSYPAEQVQINAASGELILQPFETLILEFDF
jgi:D-apionolactonase